MNPLVYMGVALMILLICGGLMLAAWLDDREKK